MGHVDEPTGRVTQEKLRGHRIGKRRAVVLDVAVGLRQVEAAVVVRIERSEPKTENKASGCGKPSSSRPVTEQSLAMVVIERRRFAKEVGHGQIEPAVPVIVAAGHAHPRQVAAGGARRQPRRHALLDEAKAATVVEERVGRGIVGHEQINLAVLVEVGRDDSQAPTLGVEDACLGSDINKPAAVVAEDMVLCSLETVRIAVRILRALLAMARRRGCRVPLQVMAYVEIEVAVTVQVGPGCRGRPVAVAAKPDLWGHVLEPAVTAVVVKGVGPPSRDEQIRKAVIVVVAHSNAETVTAGHLGQAGRGGGVLEPAVAAVAEKAVTKGRVVRGGRKRPPLNRIDVEPSIAVEVEKCHTTAHRLGELSEVGAPVIEGECETPPLGVLGEGGDAQGELDVGLAFRLRR